MILAVWTVGIVLAVIAATDRRAWSSLTLIALVLVQTALAETIITDRLTQLSVRPMIDLCVGWISLSLVVPRERWTFIMPATFAIMMLAHGAFWLARSFGYDLWLPYVYTQNALWIAQLAGLAWPGGGKAYGRASSYLGSWMSFGGRLDLSRTGRRCNRTTEESV